MVGKILRPISATLLCLSMPVKPNNSWLMGELIHNSPLLLLQLQNVLFLPAFAMTLKFGIQNVSILRAFFGIHGGQALEFQFDAIELTYEVNMLVFKTKSNSLTNKLGFGPEFLGRVRLVTSVASLFGVALYNGLLKSVPLRKIFFWTTLTGAALGMTQVLLVTGINRQFGISDEWFAIGDSLILTVLGQFASGFIVPDYGSSLVHGQTCDPIACCASPKGLNLEWQLVGGQDGVTDPLLSSLCLLGQARCLGALTAIQSPAHFGQGKVSAQLAGMKICLALCHLAPGFAPEGSNCMYDRSGHLQTTFGMIVCNTFTRNIFPNKRTASFMPVLVLAAKLCPSGMEATLFATLMSISNGGSVTGGLLGAGLTQVLGVTKDNFTNLTLLLVLCNLSSLIPLPLLGLLPRENDAQSATGDTEKLLPSADETKLK
eukprot:Gb_14180 [translate_table: standard]